MGRKVSTIDRLPPSVRRMLQELLSAKRVTQLEATERINAALRELRAAGDPDALDEECPEEVTKSAVNRFAVRMEEVGEKLRKSRELSEMWIGKLGAAPQGEMGKLINEILRTLAFDLSMFTTEGNLNKKTAPQAVKMLNTLALSMQRLEKAANLNTAREKEIRQQAAEDAAQEMATVAKEEGVSSKTIERIRREVLRMAG